MQIKLSFLHSRVARRIFGLFVVSTLIPVVVLAFFSYGQICSLTEQGAEKHLKQEAKSYGYMLNARLSLLDEALTQVVATTDQSNADIAQHFSTFFPHLGILHNSTDISMLWGKNIAPFFLSDLEKEFLNSGKTLLYPRHHSGEASQIYMLRLIQKAQKPFVIIAYIDPIFLWGKADEFDLQLGFCVFGENNVEAFCSKPELSHILKSASILSKETDKMQTVDALFINSWELYLKPRFFLEKLHIVFSQPEKDVLASHNTFKTIFAGVILLSTLIIFLVSLSIIRRNTKPLEALMEGIHRISNDNFNKPVPVTSQDEYGELARSFNTMSNRVSRQLEVLTALSGIDRLILTRLKIGDIVSIIMTRTNQIISSDIVSMALVDKENESNLTTYTSHTSCSKRRDQIEEGRCPMSEEEAIQLALSRSFKTMNKGQQLPHYLNPLLEYNAQYFLVLPVIINNKLAAILSLGFVDHITLNEEDLSWAKDYTDRIAVALSNASWEEDMYYQANYDVLTNLPNRQLLKDRLEHAIVQANRDNSIVAVLFIDLDRFKSINDSLGHSVGDELLKAISQRITHCIRKDDSVARMGGDEFIIVLSTDNKGSLASSYIATIADKLLKSIAEPLMLEKHEIRVTASIGIVMYPDDGIEIESLIKNADAAMYHAKDKGKGNYQFYSEKINESSLNKLLLESDLIGAVDRGEFELYYQPKVDANTGKMQGAEGLIRWNHPTKGLISPFRFIPIVEGSSLIITIGNWVIRSACFQNKQWQEQGLEPILVAVNVAVKQLLHPGFVDSVKSAISDSGLDPRWLELEITESAAMDDMKGTITVLHELKTLGVSLSIDDYGTGYSSLQYMKDFPVDVLKIDQSFVFNLLKSQKDVAIIKSTILLAHDFGLKVIAEGVETEAHQKHLAEWGCDELQGYLFSRPVPAEEFTLLFKDSLFPNDVAIETKELSTHPA